MVRQETENPVGCSCHPHRYLLPLGAVVAHVASTGLLDGLSFSKLPQHNARVRQNGVFGSKTKKLTSCTATDIRLALEAAEVVLTFRFRRSEGKQICNGFCFCNHNFAKDKAFSNLGTNRTCNSYRTVQGTRRPFDF